jgi:hypothetical protein
MNQWFMPLNSVQIDSRLWASEWFVQCFDSVVQEADRVTLFFPDVCVGKAAATIQGSYRP